MHWLEGLPVTQQVVNAGRYKTPELYENKKRSAETSDH
jgi:hypothetical protein